MTSEADDSSNINKLKKGDVLSFDNIFRKYYKRVYYFAYRYLKNKKEAEDVVQEVFMNLWRSREQISEDYVFSKYLFKITYNSTCKILRKQSSDKRHITEIIKNFSLEDNSTLLEAEYNSLIEITNKLIQKLPPKQKNVLLLSIEEQLDPNQIAEKLGVSKKTVENYLAMAKSSLRRSLADSGILSLTFICFFLS